MCFSPEADLVGGTIVALLGIDALRHVEHRRELPVASLPLVLGLHQLIETFVWWDLQGRVPNTVGHAATWAYLLIAFVLLPPFLPLAIMAIEPRPARRRLMTPFVIVGSAVAVVLLAAMIRGPVTVELEPHHLAYDVGIPYGGIIVVLYVVATCGSLLASSVRPIVWFGLVNLPVVVVLAVFAQRGFASLWCAWAAVTSVVIVVRLRWRNRPIPAGHDRQPLTTT